MLKYNKRAGIVKVEIKRSEKILESERIIAIRHKKRAIKAQIEEPTLNVINKDIIFKKQRITIKTEDITWVIKSQNRTTTLNQLITQHGTSQDENVSTICRWKVLKTPSVISGQISSILKDNKVTLECDIVVGIEDKGSKRERKELFR